jgi:hypothetical protein
MIAWVLVDLSSFLLYPSYHLPVQLHCKLNLPIYYCKMSSPLASVSSSSPSPSALLSPPPEVRNIIYKYAFTSATPLCALRFYDQQPHPLTGITIATEQHHLISDACFKPRKDLELSNSKR